MPPPKYSKQRTIALVMRFRQVCKERGWNIRKVTQILNREFLHPQDHVKESTSNQLMYGKAGIALNPETTLALQKLITTYQEKPTS